MNVFIYVLGMSYYAIIFGYFYLQLPLQPI